MAIISEAKQAELLARTKSRSAAGQVRKYVPEQLAFWPEDRRAIANELARSSLFQCSDNRRPREQYNNAELYVLGKDAAVHYTGEELRSKDEDLFLTFAHCARDLPSGKMIVKITSSEICKMNNWRQDGRYYEDIFRSVQRMKGGVITVFSKRLAKALKCRRALEAGASDEELQRLHDELEAFERAEGALVTTGPDDDEMAGMMMNLISGEPVFTGFKKVIDGIPQGNLSWEITLDKNMVSLFAKPYLTYVDLKARQNLSATGKRLQAYFLSHKDPHPVLLSSLKKMLSLHYKDVKTLKFNITKDLDALKEHGVIHDYKFMRAADGDDWKVKVERHPANQPAQND